MPEQWISYELDVDNISHTCLFDIGLAETAPDKARTLFVSASFPCSEWDEDDDEMPEDHRQIMACMEEIGTHLGPLNAVQFACIKGGGTIRMMYYLNTGRREEFLSLLDKACGTRTHDVQDMDDPEWQNYDAFIPDVDETGGYLTA